MTTTRIIAGIVALAGCGNGATPQAETSMTTPPSATERTSATAMASATPSASPSGFDLEAFVRRTYPHCKAPVICKGLAYVDCDSAADGPAYYLDAHDGARVSTCGGACMRPAISSDGTESEGARMCRTMCPPPEWNCK